MRSKRRMEPPNRLDSIEDSLALYINDYERAKKRNVKLPILAPLKIEDAIFLLDEAHVAEKLRVEVKQSKAAANTAVEKYIKLYRKRK